MKFVIVFVALFAIAMANDVEILHSESEVGPEDFKYSFETSDGTAAEEEGHLKNIGTEEEAISVKGSYKYVGDDGVTYEVKYTADENGFQPEGAHLPVAPEA
ncbi:larval cuticle protein 65Ag1-like [Cochliomyia hominivorax]